MLLCSFYHRVVGSNSDPRMGEDVLYLQDVTFLLLHQAVLLSMWEMNFLLILIESQPDFVKIR